MFNLPTLLTWLRIVLIPLFIGIYYLPEKWLPMPDKNLTATAFFVLAAVTDWFDGYLARKLNQTSSFGAFLDPVADKLMVAAALVMLVQLGRADAMFAVIIIGREITISALREWMAGLGARKSVAVSYVGKLKTAAQMIAITALLFDWQFASGTDTRMVGRGLLVIAVILTLWSMVYYLRQAWPLMVGHDEKKEK
ncbi:CDP-diacylglycerol--glycerol-3-phosphate 3-phosphatidyltransferase [Leeia sp. TBRC 13508]|uniref:CDP-diacylglycerol--glycerol-3-phosphate 3-phosphatidyltransferase n=1 Tax=Leeia speluncae TaxID=2884804 RepID=A0ABS8D564_9NEIS|nr:CDP-diacylglycerol--glycerol-3-phosphate 3-phosphatidyltransferase [Leeia speluncae]MCB6183116.1 CDP-diacylglycerol--glycerol-3-phosphate 3-phosphatidyltransferase [Leeia speluncae]